MIGVKYSTVRGDKKQKKRQGFLKKIGLDKLVEQAGAIFLKLLGTKNDIKTELDKSTSYRYDSGDYSGMWGGSWGGRSSSYSKPKEKFEIVDPDDPDETQWTYDDEDFLEAAKEAGLKIEKVKEDPDKKNSKEITRITLDKAEPAYDYKFPSSRSVQLCGFQGTKEYLNLMFGRSLHKADEEWYRACPYNESSGVPTHYASTVINDLVRPYGMGVAKIFVRKGLSTHTDAPGWMKALGINPMAIGDHTIDNHTFIKRMIEMKAAAAEKKGKPMSDEDRQKMYDEMLEYCNKNYRFEYVEVAPKGSILLYALGSKRTGGAAPSHASGHGHTKFYAPRERQEEETWKIALQLDELSNIEYKVDPPECPEPKLEKVLKPWECTVGDYPMRAFKKGSFSWDKRVSDEKKQAREEKEKSEKKDDEKDKKDAKKSEKKSEKKDDKKSEKKDEKKSDKDKVHSSTKSTVEVETPEKSKK